MPPLDKEQAELYRSRRLIKRSVRPFRLEKHHWNYIQAYIGKHRRSIAKVICFIIFQTLVEIGALLYVDSSLRQHVYNALAKSHPSIFFIAALGGAIVYLIVTYLSIKYERQTVLGLINDLRRLQFSSILGRQGRAVTNEAKADFVAKISYHLPLFSLGVDHSLFGCIRWLLSACVLIALGFIAGTHMLFLLLGAIALSVLMAGIGYFIAHKYISQEVTAYSQIINHVDASLAEFTFVKSFHREQEVLEGLDTRVAFDTYFRVRRDIWLRYLNRVLFTLLFIGSLIMFAVTFSHPTMTALFYNPASTVLAGIISLYTIGLFYQAVQAGLYLLPMRLGLFLSVPEISRQGFSRGVDKKWRQVTFRTNKTKLFAEGPYFKNLSLTIKRGGRYLFVGGPRSGKTQLAQVFAGVPEFNPNGWLVVIDEERLDMRHWSDVFSDRYYFVPQFRTEKTLGELILAKNKEDISEEDIAKVYAVCKKHQAFHFLLGKKRFLGESASAFATSDAALFAIQSLYCIINATGFIVIDNRWVDAKYPEIAAMTEILGAELPESAIIVYSREDNEFLNYGTRYEIKDGSIQVG